MSEENTQVKEVTTPDTNTGDKAVAPKNVTPENKTEDSRGRGGRNDRKGGRGSGRPQRRRRDNQPDDGIDSKLIQLDRVTRVVAGGKRMRFRATMVVGDRKGKVGFAVRKGADVQIAIQKATAAAKRKMYTVNVGVDSVPHTVLSKFKAAEVLVKPAPKGHGLKAGGAVRQVLEIAGVQNCVAKILRTSNKISNINATLNALKQMRTPKFVNKKK